MTVRASYGTDKRRSPPHAENIVQRFLIIRNTDHQCNSPCNHVFFAGIIGKFGNRNWIFVAVVVGVIGILSALCMATKIVFGTDSVTITNTSMKTDIERDEIKQIGLHS